MLPVVRGEDETRRQIVLYSLVLVALTLVLSPFGLMGVLVLRRGRRPRARCSSCYAVRLWRQATPQAARRLYLYSMLYLFALFAAMAVDRVLVVEEVETDHGSRRQSTDLGRQEQHRHGQAQGGQGADLRQVVLPRDPAGVPLVNLETGEQQVFPTRMLAGEVICAPEADLRRAGLAARGFPDRCSVRLDESSRALHHRAA